MTSRGLTSSSAISGCAAIASPRATTARAAAPDVDGGPAAHAVQHGRGAQRAQQALGGGGVERRQGEGGVAQRLDQDPAQADQDDGAEARVARRADHELDAVAHVGRALDEEQLRREAPGHLGRGRAQLAGVGEPDAHAAGVRLVHEPGVDGLERDGVEPELARRTAASSASRAGPPSP